MAAPVSIAAAFNWIQQEVNSGTSTLAPDQVTKIRMLATKDQNVRDALVLLTGQPYDDYVKEMTGALHQATRAISFLDRRPSYPNSLEGSPVKVVAADDMELDYFYHESGSCLYNYEQLSHFLSSSKSESLCGLLVDLPETGKTTTIQNVAFEKKLGYVSLPVQKTDLLNHVKTFSENLPPKKTLHNLLDEEFPSIWFRILHRLFESLASFDTTMVYRYYENGIPDRSDANSVRESYHGLRKTLAKKFNLPIDSPYIVHIDDVQHWALPNGFKAVDNNFDVVNQKDYFHYAIIGLIHCLSILNLKSLKPIIVGTSLYQSNFINLKSKSKITQLFFRQIDKESANAIIEHFLDLSSLKEETKASVIQRIHGNGRAIHHFIYEFCLSLKNLNGPIPEERLEEAISIAYTRWRKQQSNSLSQHARQYFMMVTFPELFGFKFRGKDTILIPEDSKYLPRDWEQVSESGLLRMAYEDGKVLANRPVGFQLRFFASILQSPDKKQMNQIVRHLFDNHQVGELGHLWEKLIATVFSFI